MYRSAASPNIRSLVYVGLRGWVKEEVVVGGGGVVTGEVCCVTGTKVRVIVWSGMWSAGVIW